MVSCLVVAAALFAPTARAAGPAQACRPGAASTDVFSRVGEQLADYLNAHNGSNGWLSAIAVAVVTPTGTQIVNCGVTTRGGTAAVDSATRYELGSETKVFTATALAQLVERHVVALDDPLSRYFTGTLPAAGCPSAHGAEITLRMLATHDAGLPRDPKNATWGLRNPMGRAGYTRADLDASFVRGFASPCAALQTPPGTAYSYSNWGFALLGTALTDAYFRSTHPGQAVPNVPAYGDMIQQLVTGPLRLPSTALELDGQPATTSQPSCPDDVATPCFWNNTNAYAGGGGLVSTIADMAAFVEANLSASAGGPLAPGLALTRQPAGYGPACLHAPSSPTCQGLAWAIWPPGPQRPSPAFRTWEKDGGTWGSASNTWFMPDACWGMTVLTNSSSSTPVLLGPAGFVSELLRSVGPSRSLCR